MASESLSFYPSEALVMPLTLIRRERRLPMTGEILVHQGERVEPIQVVGRVHQTQDFRIIDVARFLRVSRSQADRLMVRKIGDVVEARQPLTAPWGLWRTRARAPVAGEIIAMGKGRVLLEVVPELVEVRAYLKGTVASVIPGTGVVIETPGALIQGTWGCGGEAFGVLRIVTEKPNQPIRDKSIDVSCHGAIVVGTGWIDATGLEQAQQLQLCGMIAGSMDGELREKAESLGFPIILTEGFGRMPMAEATAQLLRAQTGREASICGTTRERFGVTRPEVLIPLPTESRLPLPPPPGAPLNAGARVRIVRAPYLGAIGTVTAIPDQMRRLESGARVYGAEVDLGGDTGTVFVPCMNLELLR